MFKIIEGYFPLQFQWESPKLRLVFFCSTSIQQAQKKFDEFKFHTQGQGNSVLIESFRRTYRETCKTFGIVSIDDEFEKQTPYQIWTMIEDEQPEVAQALLERHNNIWNGVDRDNVVVVFTSIATLYNWRGTRTTKALNHPDFNGLLGDDETTALIDGYEVVACILDDFNDHDLIWQLEQRVIDKIGELQHDHPNWRNLPKDLRRSVFEIQGEFVDCDEFEKFDERMRLDLEKFKGIAVDFDAIPFGNDSSEAGMYRAKHGKGFGIAVRDWMQSLVCPKIFLTTESVMAKLVKAVVPSHCLIECNLDAVPGLHPVQVPVIFDKRARAWAKEREALANEILDNSDNGIVICNGVKGYDRITNFTNMKGVNDYVDNNIYIIITMLSNDHYAILNTLGQFIGETNIIKSYYRDLVSQAIGRNTGYRDSGNGREAVIIAGSRLIKAGYFDNDDGDSDNPAMVREFLTYPWPEMLWC